MPVTLRLPLAVLFFAVTLAFAEGAASANSSESARAVTSSQRKGRSLSSLIVTVSRFVPMLEIVSVMELVAPFTRDTRTTRENTPMIMPSIVRNERILLEAMDFQAILND